MYFILLRHDNGTHEFKLLEFDPGFFFDQRCENFMARMGVRLNICRAFRSVCKDKYGPDIRDLICPVFEAAMRCFRDEKDLPYLERLFEYSLEMPESERVGRMAEMDRIFNSHLSPIRGNMPYRGEATTCAFTLPTHLVARETRKFCAMIAHYGEELEQRKSIFKPLFSDAGMTDGNIWLQKFGEIQRFFPFSDLVGAAGDIINLSGQKSGLEKLALLEDLVRSYGNDFQYREAHALLLRQAAKCSLKDVRRNARWAFLDVSKTIRHDGRLSLEVWLKALNSGFDFGEQGARNRELWLDVERLAADELEGLRARIGTESKKAIPPVEVKPVEDGTDEALWAWPIEKLVAYIEPVRRKRRRRPKPKRKNHVSSTQEISRLPEEEDQSIELKPVPERDQALVELGRRNSLVLFQEEIRAGLDLARQLSLEGDTVGQLQSCCEKVTLFMEADILPEQDIDACLLQAMDLLSRLRDEIEQRNKDSKRLEDFDLAIMAAVVNEPIIFGKRYGGVIEHGISDINQWSEINDCYHNRLISNCNEIRIGRRIRYLREDEAIVFYVTFTSMSGYAFDISGHLWRRYADAGDVPPASGSDGPHKLMDLDNWYDTYIPCFVLHVPWSQ